MIIVITSKEWDGKTGRMELIVSHGINSTTDKTVILPPETPETLGAVFDSKIGEYVLPSN